LNCDGWKKQIKIKNKINLKYEGKNQKEKASKTHAGKFENNNPLRV